MRSHSHPRTSPFQNRFLARVWRFLAQDVWMVDLDRLSKPKAFVYKTYRVVYLTIRGFVQDNCLFRSSALTYITALSIVPLLAFVFAVAKALGAYDSLEPYLHFESDEQGAETLNDAIAKLFDFVESTDVTKLGSIGAIILLMAIVKMLGTAEKSFNDIWGVQRSRSILRKLSDYLAIVVIVPVFIATAIALTSVAQVDTVITFLKERLYLGWLIEALGGLTAVFALWLGFTFIYRALPNTRTKWSSAALGGLVAGLLWYGSFVLYVRFNIGVVNYNKIYAGFAAAPIFLAWIQVSWVVVLLGAELAFAHQSEPAYRQIAQSRPSDHAFREVLALRSMVRIATTFIQGEEPLTAAEIAARVGVPPRQVEEVLVLLEHQSLLAIAEGVENECFVPARDLELITIKSVLDALKGTSGPVDVPAQGAIDEELDRLVAHLDEEMRTSPKNRNLRELAREAGRDVERPEALVQPTAL